MPNFATKENLALFKQLMEQTSPDLEVVQYQTTTPLTDEQVAKARAGELAIAYGGDIAFKTDVYSAQGIVFQTHMGEYADQAAGNFERQYSRTYVSIYLNTTTKMLSLGGTSQQFTIKDTSNNVFDNTDVPTASGKQIVRAKNLRRTQDMLTPNVYDATATYAVGDLVIYQNQLYKCTTAITVAEAWNSSHWSLTNMVEYIKTSEASGARIVEVTSTGVQTEEMAARIKDADALLYNSNTYWKTDDSAPLIEFRETYIGRLSVEIGENKIQYNDSDRSITLVTSHLFIVQRDDLVSEFSTSAQYYPGDIVYRSNNVYRCIVAHTGAWSNNDFTQIVLADEIHSDIVTISATGVQSDAMAAKILNAKAVVYGKQVYTLYSENASSKTFRSMSTTVNTITNFELSYTKSTKAVTTVQSSYDRVVSFGGQKGSISVDSSLEVNASTKIAKLTGKLPYLTTLPTADNTSGFLTIVVLSSEPATRYNGYLYIITAAAA